MGEYTATALERLRQRVQGYESDLRDMQQSLGDGAGADTNDWHDNPAFDEKQRRIRELQLLVAQGNTALREAVVIEKISSDVVCVGSDVVIRYAGEEDDETVHLAGQQAIRSDTDDVLSISSTSPLGAALIGAAAGDEVEFMAPNGVRITVAVVKVL